jgi:hypothetical protein
VFGVVADPVVDREARVLRVSGAFCQEFCVF